MKRFFLSVLAFFLCLGWSARAAYYEYNAWIYGPVAVTDLSYGSNYMYRLDFQQVGKSGSNNYVSEARIIICPDSPSIVGTFTYRGGTIDGDSYVYYSGSTRMVTDYSTKYTEITIADAGNGNYTLSGAFRTNKGSNYYYYYYDGTTDYDYTPKNSPTTYHLSNTFDIYGAEPSKTSVSISPATKIDFLNNVSSYGNVLIDIYNAQSDFVELALVSDKFDVPSGTYSVSASGGKGTLAAAPGFSAGYYPIGSYLSYSWDYYYITGGSVEVSYSKDNTTVTIEGTLTTAHGTEISVSGTAANPFYKEPEPEPQTIELTVSSVSAVFNGGEKPNFELSIGAKNGEVACNGYIRLTNTSTLAGTYDYNNIYSWSYMGKNASEEFNYIDSNSSAHSVKIEATGTKNEYKLNSSLVCEDKNTYVIKDFIFTYIPPTPPGPWDAEEEQAETISFTTAATPYIYDNSVSGEGITLQYYNVDFNTIYLTFAVDSKSQILPCRYVVDGSKALGTLIASEGRHIGATDADTYETYSYYGKGMTEDPYYITGGYVDVTYSGSSMLISGILTTHKGSTITVNIVSNNTGEGTICASPLPVNVMNGYLSGTDATYMLAYDVTTSDDGKLSVLGTLVPSAEISGLKPQVKVGTGVFTDMTYDSTTGACSFETSSSYTAGDKVTLELKLVYTAGSTDARTINYTVE